jgi:mono/diheme cytochrome c family protein
MRISSFLPSCSWAILDRVMPSSRLPAPAHLLAALALLAAPAFAQEPAAQPEQPPDEFATNVRPIVEQHCYPCHGNGETDNGLNLAQFATAADALAAPDVWEHVMERVNLYEMPPEGSPQLDDPKRNALIGWIEAHRRPEDDCHKLATDANQRFYQGHVMSRRLSRGEYNNTIRDLTGLDLRPADAFPSDGSGGEGFDNTGDTLFVSPVLLEQYLLAATRVLDAALPEREEMTEEVTNEDKQSSNPPHSSFGFRHSSLASQLSFPTADLPPQAAARQSLAGFARRAFRRPVADEELDRLMTLFDRAQSRGDAYLPSLKLALKAVLISPHFLFLVEPQPESEGVYPLDHHQLAARLSYFIWNSMPDDELARLADEAKLRDDAVLRDQVRRMLADPKARGLAESFAIQWLGIGALGQTVRPDADRFPEFDPQLADDMRDEAITLVETILCEDRSLLELIDADYAVVNDRLAAHYGLPSVEGPELRKVSLDDRRRGGVLGLGAVLTATSLPLRTSPVLRGKWVLEEILGDHVPPPPPNAGVLPEDDRQDDGLTLRQRLEQHRTNPECAACHQRMDPLGFGLESFDAVGRWRDENLGQPIDSSGTLPGGQTFSGPAELKQVLLERRGQFLHNLTRKMLGYALGRGLSKFDDCVVREAVKALEASNCRSSVLIEQIALSYPFRHRYAKK